MGESRDRLSHGCGRCTWIAQAGSMAVTSNVKTVQQRKKTEHHTNGRCAGLGASTPCGKCKGRWFYDGQRTATILLKKNKHKRDEKAANQHSLCCIKFNCTRGQVRLVDVPLACRSTKTMAVLFTGTPLWMYSKRN